MKLAADSIAAKKDHLIRINWYLGIFLLLDQLTSYSSNS